MVYLVVLLLILFGIFWYDYMRHKTGRILLWVLICGFLICIAGLRYRLGQDTLTYIGDYAAIHPISQIRGDDFVRTRFAPGFVVVSSIFKQFTSDFTWFQLFQAAVVNSVLFCFFYKHCRHIFFAALVYFFYLYFLYSFQQMRESFAVCVFLMSWDFFRQGKWLLWYIASIIGFLFHMSAIMMFFLPLICMPGLRQLFIFGKRTWFVCVGVFVFSIIVQAVFFKYLEIIAISASMLERIRNYQHNYLGGSILNFNGMIGTFFQYILYPVLSLYFLQKLRSPRRENSSEFRKFDAMVLMSVFVAVFSISVTIMARYENYFFPFAILAMCDWLFSYIKVKRKKLRLRLVYWVIIFLPMFAFHISGTYFSDMNRSGTLKAYMVYYPYTSVLDKSSDPKTEKAINYLRRRI